MKIIDILAIIMAELKKTYGKQFEVLTDTEKKLAIMQFLMEITSKYNDLKYRICDVFYEEMKEM